MRHAFGAQFIKTGIDNRRGEFQIAIFNRPIGENWRQLFGQNGKFGDG